MLKFWFSMGQILNIIKKQKRKNIVDLKDCVHRELLKGMTN